MKKLISILVSITISLSTLNAQDTIFAKKNGKIETVPCKITKITSMRVFYTENKIGSSISLKDLDNYKVSAESSQKMAINNGFMEAPKSIISITEQSAKQIVKGKGWLILSGVALLGSGVCNLIVNNRKNDTTTAQIDFDKSQKTIGNISSACTAISGISLIIGVTIHFK